MRTIELDERGLLVLCNHCGQRNRMAYDLLGETFRCGKCQSPLPAPREPIELGNATEFQVVTAQSRLAVLVDFWAPWCGPCKMVAPELVKVASQGAGQFLVAKANTEELPEVAQEFGISAIPTLVLFQGGRELARHSGAVGAAQIHQFLAQARVE